MNEVQEKVKLPAIGLLVTAGVGILAQCLSAVGAIVTMAAGTAAAAAQTADKDVQAIAIFNAVSGPIRLVLAVVGLLGAVFIIYGALKMKALRSYGLSVASAVLAMIPAVSPCCCIGLPIGIWALVVLMNDDVKRAFQ